jgi:Zn-dependent protease
MNHQDSVAFWSFPLGNWFGITVRISWFFPVLIAYFLIRPDYSLRFGIAVSVILVLTTLLHEFGHIFGARLTGGSGNEILLWPLGGLAFVRPASTLKSQLITTGGGPLVDLGICVATLIPTMNHLGDRFVKEGLNPFVLPYLPLEQNLVLDLIALTFCLNWMLLLVNMIPVMPLDGGHMLRTIATTRVGHRKAVEIGVMVGFVVGVIAMLVGLFINRAGVVLIGAIVFIANLLERNQLQQADHYDESFMGYDFSQGYTSLEQSETKSEPRPGFWKRWKDRRRAEKERRQAEKDQEVERVLDELLEKVHQHGMDSLSEAEKRQLARASARYRNKGNPQA